jgi:hypothetical protein
MISRKEPVDIEYATTVSTMSAAARTYGPDAQWVRNVLDRGEAARQPGDMGLVHKRGQAAGYLTS